MTWGEVMEEKPLVLRKEELEFRASASEVEMHIWDYHADPVHLSLEDLARLGLTPTEERGPLEPSEVAPWRRALAAGRSRDVPIPHLSDEHSARALHLGGVAWLPVAEGLDLYILSYHASPVRLDTAHLARLGLRQQGR